MIPKEPGEYKFGDYFQWVFFNPRLKKYDTLKSRLTVHVTGESKKNEAIQSSDVGNFYDKIEFADNSLRTIKDNQMAELGIQWFYFGDVDSFRLSCAPKIIVDLRL